MLKRVFVLSIAVIATASLARKAQASQIVNYSSFCPSTGLTMVGSATVDSSCHLQLTSSITNDEGAAYGATPITLGTGDTFSTTFHFQFTNSSGSTPADGITFMLSQASTGLGATGGGLGYEGVPNSVAIEFDTYNNGSPDGNSSNHVAIDENGVLSDLNLTSVYGNGSCDAASGGSYTADGCMSNGHVWAANISYDGTNLSVVLRDPNEAGAFTAYAALPLDIASLVGSNTAYVGFTAGTGADYETQTILDWQLANDTSLAAPEPGMLILLAIGVVGLLTFHRRQLARARRQ